MQLWVSTPEGPVELCFNDQEAVLFVAECSEVQLAELLASIANWRSETTALKDFQQHPVRACYFTSQHDLRRARELLKAADFDPLESDVRAVDRFLMERFIFGGLSFLPQSPNNASDAVVNPRLSSSDYWPTLRCISLDIETSVTELVLYSIAVYAAAGQGSAPLKYVFIIADEDIDVDAELNCYDSERALLLGFLAWLQTYDPDIILGWNVVNFDFWFLERLFKKHQLAFRCGRNGAKPYWRELDDEGQRRSCFIAGRVLLDGIDLLKAAAYHFESYSLANVASEVLGDSKLLADTDKGRAITQLYRQDKAAFINYNLQDCVLAWNIIEQFQLLDFAIARSKITGLALERNGGSVASFDFRYLPLLHRQGYVAPNGHLADSFTASPGGFVMSSRPGVYDHVLVLDFKSLYPAIIRSFNIDPLAMADALSHEQSQSELVPGFDGAWFSRRYPLLPNIIAQLWQARDEAKQANNQALSQAIKIIMNAFYGVLGSGGCRFHDPRLARSITRRGHQIIQQTATYIEAQPRFSGQLSAIKSQVIYGDTDSVFVWLQGCQNDADACRYGALLAGQLNHWWRQRLAKNYQINSALEIEFETHFRRFLMPTIRGSSLGSKKRYAGLLVSDEGEQLIFKGLEHVRSDWTPLARAFQREVYRRIFLELPYRDYIKTTVKELLAGQHDQQLLYRKRLRRKLVDYRRNIPPHVQAARKGENVGQRYYRGDWVNYLMTLHGPEPQPNSSPIDYQHYIDKQLAPAVDSILQFFDTSFADIVDRQLSFF